jgi:hypothetical protein
MHKCILLLVVDYSDFYALNTKELSTDKKTKNIHGMPERFLVHRQVFNIAPVKFDPP